MDKESLDIDMDWVRLGQQVAAIKKAVAQQSQQIKVIEQALGDLQFKIVEHAFGLKK